jgi:hypothetical protein
MALSRHPTFNLQTLNLVRMCSIALVAQWESMGGGRAFSDCLPYKFLYYWIVSWAEQHSRLSPSGRLKTEELE